MAALTLAVIKQNLVSYSCESEGRFLCSGSEQRKSIILSQSKSCPFTPPKNHGLRHEMWILQDMDVLLSIQGHVSSCCLLFIEPIGIPFLYSRSSIPFR